MNEALYDLNSTAETYWTIGIVILLYVIGSVLFAMWVMWYNRFANVPTLDSEETEGTQLITRPYSGEVSASPIYRMNEATGLLGK